MENTPNEDLLNTEIPQNKGALQLTSMVQLSDSEKPVPAVIYEKCFIIDGKRCVKYDFDLKMTVAEGTIKFQHLDNTLVLLLPQKDHQQWRTVLKKYINQRGFHQDFKPIKKIGKGNFASVYLAERTDTKLKCAVKAFSKEAAFSEQNGKQCLIKEIEIMRHLDNKNCMKCYEVYESDNSLYIVFELLEGGLLYDKIKSKQKFTQTQIKIMIKGLLEGLREMHSKNVMHRDLKPENILFRSQDDYDCVIADYGLAQFSTEENYLFVRCGTPGYVAPEVINIRDMKTKYSPICDMFSLGLIFHSFLLGRSAFKGTTYNEVLSQNRSCDFKLEGTEYDKLSKETLDLLKKMLRKNPEERISAEQAFAHPYFKEEIDEELDEESMEKADRITEIDSNTLAKTRDDAKKDSLLTFKMGRQNAFNGKTDTVGSVNSAKLSFGGNLFGSKAQKSSKFTNKPAN